MIISTEANPTVAPWNQKKLHPEVKTRWLEALRSGKYNQTNGFLSRNGGYCCLGVLCQIAVQDKVVQIKPVDSVLGFGVDSVLGFGSQNDFSTKVLPDSVSEWSGLFTENPTLDIPLADVSPRKYMDVVALANLKQIQGAPDGTYYFRASLAELNDAYLFNFSEIADIVEKYL